MNVNERNERAFRERDGWLMRNDEDERDLENDIRDREDWLADRADHLRDEEKDRRFLED